ncbi:proteasome subunit beta type-4 [Condylostylus longicornis]|uniref:proteasome subunit beta type-4 n=1 Tax=Condylostylus longicornis TaxID=2530218 RepID=UPI00244E4A61|nr:proteasome subunit beta type-4 [Condylostylus longicornis]
MMPIKDSFLRPLWHNGPTPGKEYNFPSKAPSASSNTGDYGNQRSAQPIATGTSVLGIKFDGGVIIAADNLVSYGSLARFQDVQRVFEINPKTVIGAGGDYADFQFIKRLIDDKIVEDICYDDDIVIKPKSLYTWVIRLQYYRRSWFNPLWVDMVIGGLEDGVPFLGHVDLRGRAYEDYAIATGYGKHIAIPLLREHLDGKTLPSKETALDLIKKCMEVLYYRDCRSLSTYNVIVCDKDGAVIHKDLEVNQNWALAPLIKGY